MLPAFDPGIGSATDGRLQPTGLLPGLVESVNTVWDAKQFHFSLMASEQLVLRARSRSGAGAVTLVFDLAGYVETAQNFRESCL